MPVFQSFEVTARPEQGPGRLAALRVAMEAAGLDGFIVPRADAHQGENVSPRDERLAWLTGFTGSAGLCAVLADKAGVFVDGRYETQVKSQVDLAAFIPVAWTKVPLGDWLAANAPEGSKIGYNPWLNTVWQIEEAQTAVKAKRIELVACDDLVDSVWPDQPGPANAPATIHPLDFAGEAHDAKRARVGAVLAKAGAQAAVLTLPDSICWLLNIRGADIPRTPIVQSFAILHASGRVDLFVDPAKVSDLGAHFGPDITCHTPDHFLDAVAALDGPVRLAKSTVPVIVADIVGDKVQWGADPCGMPKACKNAAEIAGSVAAHLRDGAAVVEVLAWLDAQEPGSLTETEVVTRLEAARREDNALRDISFETIAGTGPNGAIMHYRVTEETDATLEDGHLLVLDSGGQYLDGTTDITRTVSIGTPPQEARHAFTRVLSGMIAMSRLRWPKGLTGRDIEAVARAPLWYAHQDFDHGLGHGVGAYLSVHEGPQRLSRTSSIPLKPGMILSNEPGYYRVGAFGIRIENLVVVEAVDAPEGGDAHREMLGWRTLTYAPIDRRLIVKDALDTASLAWLDDYHAQVLEKIGPRVSQHAQDWLKSACAPL